MASLIWNDGLKVEFLSLVRSPCQPPFKILTMGWCFRKTKYPFSWGLERIRWVILLSSYAIKSVSTQKFDLGEKRDERAISFCRSETTRTLVSADVAVQEGHPFFDLWSQDQWFTSNRWLQNTWLQPSGRTLPRRWICLPELGVASGKFSFELLQTRNISYLFSVDRSEGWGWDCFSILIFSCSWDDEQRDHCTISDQSKSEIVTHIFVFWQSSMNISLRFNIWRHFVTKTWSEYRCERKEDDDIRSLGFENDVWTCFLILSKWFFRFCLHRWLCPQWTGISDSAQSQVDDTVNIQENGNTLKEWYGKTSLSSNSPFWFSLSGGFVFEILTGKVRGGGILAGHDYDLKESVLSLRFWSICGRWL